MDPSLNWLTDVEKCDQYIENVAEKHPDLVPHALRKKFQLQAAEHHAKTPAEEDALQTVFAYEHVLRLKHGKRQPATYTWRGIKNHGIKAAVVHAVTKTKDPTGFTAMVKEGLADMTYEQVVLRHQNEFDIEVVECARRRVEELGER